MGTLLKEVRDTLSKHGWQSSKTYTSSRGKKSFAGTRYLKHTQSLGCLGILWCTMISYTWFELIGWFCSRELMMNNGPWKSNWFCTDMQRTMEFSTASSLADDFLGTYFESIPLRFFSTPRAASNRLLLRTYPPRFAMRIAKYFSRLCRTREALPSDPEGFSPLTGREIFLLLDWESNTWDDADLASTLLYLRGSKSLNLGDWRPLFPTSIPMSGW